MAHILIVDDSRVLRKLMRRVLERANLQIVEASCGLEALKHLRDSREIQLMVTDLIMEDISGIELTAMAQDDWPQLKVLLVSSFPRREAFEKYQGNVSTAVVSAPFLQKPFSPSQLLSAVGQLLNLPRADLGALPASWVDA